jgi:hypothetical protein
MRIGGLKRGWGEKKLRRDKIVSFLPVGRQVRESLMMVNELCF